MKDLKKIKKEKIRNKHESNFKGKKTSNQQSTR